VLGYCIEQENGGCIKNASEWRDRQWQQTAGVTLREVRSAGRLLAWDQNDLRVMFYPVEKENEVKAKRIAGSSGGKASGETRRKQTASTASISACDSASTERNGKERNTPIVPKGDDQSADSEASLTLEIDASSEPDFPEKKEKAGAVDCPALVRARGLFRMKPETPLDASQERAWRKNRAAVIATQESGWQALEWWFGLAANHPQARYRRRDLAQVLNHWNGEIERAAIEAHNCGVEFAGTVRKRTVPENWRDIILEACPEFNCPDRFEEVPESVRAYVWESISKK
jgi:hypothetical protein